MERQILAIAIADRGDYDILSRYDIRDTLDDQAQIIWDCLVDYYSTDNNAQSIDLPTLKVGMERKYPKHFELLGGVIDDLPEPAAGNVKHEILEQKREFMCDAEVVVLEEFLIHRAKL